MTQIAVHATEKTRCGTVVWISTALAEQANSTVPPVLASLTKGGLNAATTSLAIEFATRDIRVHAVSLGIAKTPTRPAATYAALAAMNPIGTFASFVTGEFITGAGPLNCEGSGPVSATALH